MNIFPVETGIFGILLIFVYLFILYFLSSLFNFNHSPFLLSPYLFVSFQFSLFYPFFLFLIPPRRPGFAYGQHVGFVVDKAALGQVFSEYFGFPCQSFHHNHPGLAQ
jgi:hypothetical protein